MIEFFSFLALLDYASRVMVWGLCPSSVVRVAIISEPIEQIPFKLQLWVPLGNTHRCFLNFWNKWIFIFFRICFRSRVNHVNMGPYGSQKFQKTTPPWNQFWIYLNFFWISSQWSSQKYFFGFLKLWDFDFSGFLLVFINMEQYGSQNFKLLLLPQITF